MSKNIAGAQINVHTCSRDMQLDLNFMSCHARVSISICSHTLESLPYIAYVIWNSYTLPYNMNEEICADNTFMLPIYSFFLTGTFQKID